MPDVGLSFSPTSAPGQYGGAQSGRPGGGVSPVMDAIKILSFRVPQVLGQNAPVAPSLLAGGAAGGGATPMGSNAALVDQFMQRFFGAGLAQNRDLLGQLAGMGAPPIPIGGNPTIGYNLGEDRQAYTPMAPQAQSGPPPAAPPPDVQMPQFDPFSAASMGALGTGGFGGRFGG